ncbi:hypothetical protein VB735_26255 [Halotia wernerae UHCC 0503]|nr:hypothetical protein [Halotia wernerae UHCC 0503]
MISRLYLDAFWGAFDLECARGEAIAYGGRLRHRSWCNFAII